MTQVLATADPLERAVEVYAMGAICPAELWRIIESAVPASELMASLNGIDERAQTTLRQVYHDRPISRSEISKNPAFARALRKWIGSTSV